MTLRRPENVLLVLMLLVVLVGIAAVTLSIHQENVCQAKGGVIAGAFGPCIDRRVVIR